LGPWRLLLLDRLVVTRDDEVRTVDQVSEHALTAPGAFSDRAAERGSRAGLGPELREIQRDQSVGPTRRAKDQCAHDPDGLSRLWVRTPAVPDDLRHVRVSRKSSGSQYVALAVTWPAPT
jgi:hypothetical protein